MFKAPPITAMLHLALQDLASTWAGPVPPLVEQILARKMARASKYTNIAPVPGSPGTFDVRSARDATKKYRVVMSPFPNTPPSCCAWSLVDGMPCDHGVAVAVRQHGTANLHKFIEVRYLSATWKLLYADATFELPAQHVLDRVMLEAKQRVLSGEYLHLPKALPPPRGRPVKDAGLRKQAWYEHGATSPKKREYLRSLCHLKGHTREKCELRQMFGDDQAP